MGKADAIASEAKWADERRGGTAVLRVVAPGVRALTPEGRADLFKRIDAAEADNSVTSIVLAGDTATFATGTSLEPASEDEPGPDLAALCDRIEACEKPVVAAISGAALGNGLEIAIAAHSRVVGPDARLGAPAMSIGLVPNGGGTQRLPKLIGGLAALKLLLSGRSVGGKTAVKLELAEELASEDVLSAATARAEAMAASGAPLVRNSERRDKLGQGKGFLEIVAQHRAIARSEGSDAPLRLIECVEAALLLPYDIGRGLEQAAFDDLVVSDHSRALRHVLGSERMVQTRSAASGRVMSRPLSHVGVLGARGLGTEVVVAALDSGLEVTVAELSDAALEDGVTRIIEHYDARVTAGNMTDDAVEATLDRMHAVCGYRTLSAVDLVIDPGPAISKARVRELDAVLKAGALLATASDRVDLARIAGATSRPGDVVSLRLYPGLTRHRAAELSHLPETAANATETARAFARRLGRLIIETGPTSPGVGARLTDALHAAADRLVIEGARIGEVDDTLRAWGLPMGSFAWRDVAGLQRGADYVSSVDAQMVAAGRTGRSGGRGYYVYQTRGQPATEDPDVLNIIAEMQREEGISPRVVTASEIRHACISAMAGAGAAMLMDSTASRPLDIDMIAIHGLGFQRRTGGPMFAADLIGLQRVSDTLEKLARADDRIQPPADVFADLIRAKKGFADLNG